MREIIDYKLIISQDPGAHEAAAKKLLEKGYIFRGEIKAVPAQQREDLYNCLISEMILFKS